MWMVKILVLSEGSPEKLTGPLLADWIPAMDGIPRKLKCSLKKKKKKAKYHIALLTFFSDNVLSVRIICTALGLFWRVNIFAHTVSIHRVGIIIIINLGLIKLPAY